MTRPYDYTPERHVRLMFKRQDGKCPVAKCGAVLHLEKPRNFIIEHLHQLATGGKNRLKDKRLYCLAHAKKKTHGTKATSAGSDAHARAKIRRLANPKPSRRPMRNTGRKLQSAPMRRNFKPNVKDINDD